MSKIFIALLSATMALTLVPASAAMAAAPEYAPAAVSSVSADAWEINIDETDIFLTGSFKAAFSEASKGYGAGRLEVLALYAESSVSSGTYYKMICRQTKAEYDVSLKDVTIFVPYSDVKSEKARFTSVKSFNIEDYTTDYRYELPDEPKVGGMALSTSGEVDLPKEVYDVLTGANEKTSMSYTPLAYLGKKTTANGTDYALICYDYDIFDDNHDEYVDVVIIHSDSTVKSSHSIMGRRTVFSNQFRNLCSLDKVNIVQGENIKINFGAKNGTGNYTYMVSYHKYGSDKWYTKEFDGSTKYFKFRPAVATTYEIVICASDGETSMAFSALVTVDSRLQNVSSVSKETAEVGEMIDVYNAATGGIGDKQFAVYYRRKNTEKWHCVQKYSYRSHTWLKAKTADDYEVCIKAKDEDGTISKKYFTVSVK